MVHGTWFTVHGSRYMVHGTRYTVCGTWHMVLGTQHMAQETIFMVHVAPYNIAPLQQPVKRAQGDSLIQNTLQFHTYVALRYIYFSLTKGF